MNALGLALLTRGGAGWARRGNPRGRGAGRGAVDYRIRGGQQHWQPEIRMRSTWRRATSATGRARIPLLTGMPARMTQRLSMCTQLSLCETGRVGDRCSLTVLA
jgi:hypothetical protein